MDRTRPVSPIFALVIEDLHKRDELGYQTYGKPLIACDGRDPWQDAYEEALDLAMYLKKAIVEREFQQPQPAVVSVSKPECTFKSCPYVAPCDRECQHPNVIASQTTQGGR